MWCSLFNVKTSCGLSTLETAKNNEREEENEKRLKRDFESVKLMRH